MLAWTPESGRLPMPGRSAAPGLPKGLPHRRLWNPVQTQARLDLRGVQKDSQRVLPPRAGREEFRVACYRNSALKRRPIIMETPTLLVLAAGMGSRYGGLKQIDPMGPADETILDYSIWDAIDAGFRKVVFVIREEFEDAFRLALGDRISEHVEVGYAFQCMHDLPSGFEAPAARLKPWGTAHAVFSAREQITSPFAVILSLIHI